MIQAWALPQDLIKAQAGCYDVTWDFIEDQVFIPNYPTVSKPYHEKAMEWVTVDHDDQNRISLQHILIAGGEIQKHWRQEWIFEEPSHYDYFGHQLWKASQEPNVQGTWQRRVFQVDDSPRHECFGTWNEAAKNWSCTSWSPIPRRESSRHDYNVLARGNTHQLKASGWVLAEDNLKLNVDQQGNITKVAHELGTNTYTRADDSRCKAAQDWWTANQQGWEKVQDVWTNLRTNHPVLHVLAPPGKGPLWAEIFDLVDTAVQSKTVASPQFIQDLNSAINAYLQP
jgi:hypothetical protein